MRVAVYFDPEPSHPLADAGARWLGRDAWSLQTLPQPDIARLQDLTVAPRRYGFHATLKAPFRLKEPANLPEFEAAVATLAEATPAATIGPLTLSTEYGFLALVPQRQGQDLTALASRCVEALDRFRAPPEPCELARRRSAGLTPHQEDLLSWWGYPYVLDEFRFHMTLSDSAAPLELFELSVAARRYFDGVLSRPLAIDSICVFREPEPGAPFEGVRRFPLQQRRQEGPAA